MKKSKRALPMVEGKCPPCHGFDENGEEYWYYPEPNTDYEDPEIREEELYTIEDKEEYWGYETVCKKCGTRFMAYKDEYSGFDVRNYCPGCGKRLVHE